MYTSKIEEVLTQENKIKPTLIQEKTYEPIINGASSVGLAKTGTGKTLAYGLPVLERIKQIGGQALAIDKKQQLLQLKKQQYTTDI